MSRELYKVLVVEDEPIIQRDVVEEIEAADMGFCVKWTAYNGEDALFIMEEEHPDVLFTDIKMPIMSGLELIQKVREKDQTLPIVLLTGFSDFEYTRKAIQMKVEDYLLKPLESDQLLQVLERIVKKLEQRTKDEILASDVDNRNDQENSKVDLEKFVKEIESYIQKHYMENITVTQLAEKYHFNVNYLTKIFKKYTGESPVTYLIDRRLEKAVELMKTRKDLELHDISCMVGYDDPHYFSRIFKSKMGKSPTEYRKESEKST